MALRSLLGVQIVAQSWTLQQDEPIDYTVYAQQQEALQVQLCLLVYNELCILCLS